jgi:probable HAF family extracellular repeat protein
MHRTQLIVSALLVLASLGRLEAQEISFIGLGDLPGGAWDSRASDVSADGSVVVGSGVDSQGNTKAFRWTSPGGMVDLGSLPGGASSNAASVSADGSVVAGTSDSAIAPTEAFRWTLQTGIVGLGTLAPSIGSVGTAVSGDGSTIVGYGETPAGETEVFRWTASTGMVRLPGLQTEVRSSIASGVSFDGSFVIGSLTYNIGRREGYRWNANDELVRLPTLDLFEDIYSVPTAITPDGQTIVGHRIQTDGDVRAFRWFQREMLPLGPGDALNAFALDVSADGRVVVGSTGSRAILWSDDSIGDVQSILESSGLDLQGWNLTHATGVSADGQTIVGYGLGPRGQEAWIATIPEPTTIALAGFAAAGLIAYLLRRWMRLRAAWRLRAPNA